MQSTLRQPRVALGWITFLMIAVVGLFYVKWFPYYNRAFVAASQHSIGKSILMGTAASAPAPSWQAAIDYAIAYGKAIWQAMVLGLLLGSAVQALIPPQWVARAWQERFWQCGERWPDVAAGHDVHLLRSAGRGRPAGASGGAGSGYRVLAR